MYLQHEMHYASLTPYKCKWAYTAPIFDTRIKSFHLYMVKFKEFKFHDRIIQVVINIKMMIFRKADKDETFLGYSECDK